MDKLDELETEIVERLSLKYPSIKSHIPFLKVLNRQYTGVGVYVNFCYLSVEKLPPIEIKNGLISIDERIEIDCLKFGLIDVTSVTNGYLELIELVTYDEEWDGSYKSFKFIKSSVE